MQGFDNPCLLRRRHLCTERDFLQALRQFLISQFLYINAEKNVVGWHPHRAANFAGNDVVIAGQDLDLDPGTGQGRDRNAGALLWRIEEGDIAEQGKTRRNKSASVTIPTTSATGVSSVTDKTSRVMTS